MKRMGIDEFKERLLEVLEAVPSVCGRIEQKTVICNGVEYSLEVVYQFYKKGHSLANIGTILMERDAKEGRWVNINGGQAMLLPLNTFYERPYLVTEDMMVISKVNHRMATYGDMLQMGFSDTESFIKDQILRTVAKTSWVLIESIKGQCYLLTAKDPTVGALCLLFPQQLAKINQKLEKKALFIPVSSYGILCVRKDQMGWDELQAIQSRYQMISKHVFYWEQGHLKKLF